MFFFYEFNRFFVPQNDNSVRFYSTLLIQLLLFFQTYFHGQGIFFEGSREPRKMRESSMELGFRALSLNFEVVISYDNPNWKLFSTNPR